MSVTPYFLERAEVWFSENRDSIISSIKKQGLWSDKGCVIFEGKKIIQSMFTKILSDLNYEKVNFVKFKGEFSLRGNVLDIFPINTKNPFRVEFAGNFVADISEMKISDLEPEEIKKRIKVLKSLPELKNLKEGSYVVHLDHGIGIFQGILEENGENYFNILPEKEILSGGPEGSIELVGDEYNQVGFLSWISFDKQQKLVKANEKYDMPFEINVPENAQPGDHYAAILFRALPIKVDQNTGIGTTGRVGTVVLLNVSGETKKTGIVEKISVPKFVGRGPLKVGVKINNTGNTFFNPEGRVKISGWFQRTEKSWESKLVFPNYARNFDVSWDQKYLFGLFKITVDANVPGGEVIPSQTVYFWAFPWQESLILVLTLILIKFVVKKTKGKFKLVRID